KTIVIPITGNPATVSKNLDALLEQTNVWMRGTANRGETTDSGFAPRLEKLEDGVWCLSVGFAGPSLAIAGRYIVVGYSPKACRLNREHILANTKTHGE
ncbi:MAG: hypothetical protein GXP29_09805, partial [Planctomycetes bacterium]|nr:hypothetical protein [Planctomycetota bacterium]